MKLSLTSARLVTAICHNPYGRWSPEPVEPSLKRGVFYGLLLSLPCWALLLKMIRL
jgi:hypothetical protein